MTNNWLYLLPMAFSCFALFFGWVSFSITVRKKPVIIQSSVIAIFMTLTFIPIIVLQFVQSVKMSSLGLWGFLVPASYIFLLVFIWFILRGFSVYGFEQDDFRKLVFQSLEKLGIKSTEELGRLHLVELGTDVNISFQEMLGTGTLKSKDYKKFEIQILRRTLQAETKGSEVQVKLVTGIFYGVFSLLMFGFVGFFVWGIMQRLF